MLLVGLGMGLVFVPLTTASLAGVPAADSGAASGLVNMLQLVGGALGLGVLVAVYGTASGHAVSPHAVTHGIGVAFGFAALLDVCSLLVIIALIRTRRLTPAPAPAAAAAGRGHRLLVVHGPATGQRPAAGTGGWDRGSGGGEDPVRRQPGHRGARRDDRSGALVHRIAAGTSGSGAATRVAPVSEVRSRSAV